VGDDEGAAEEARQLRRHAGGIIVRAIEKAAKKIA